VTAFTETEYLDVLTQDELAAERERLLRELEANRRLQMRVDIELARRGMGVAALEGTQPCS
jgi:hypothetical protein